MPTQGQHRRARRRRGADGEHVGVVGGAEHGGEAEGFADDHDQDRGAEDGATWRQAALTAVAVAKRSILAGDPRFDELHQRAGFEGPHPVAEARRAIIVVEVDRIADSCGYGVPLMSYEGERAHMEAGAEKKMRSGGKDAIDAYVGEKNAVDIDGLPSTATVVANLRG